MSRDIPFDSIQAAAVPFVRTLIPRWIPGAVEKGGWMKSKVPWREDKNPSFGVSLETGFWKDFGRGEGGDLISLLSKLKHLTMVEAARELARTVGHEFGDEK